MWLLIKLGQIGDKGKVSILQILQKIYYKICYIIKHSLYVNETLILYEHYKDINCLCPASITKVSAENIADVLDFQPPRYIPIFEDFLRRGDTGYFAYLNGKCVHRSWVVHSPQTVHLHSLLPKMLQPGEAFIHYCETAPTARGRNIYPAVLSKIAEDFKSYGHSLMISANAKNKNSIKGIVKAGFAERERERVIVIAGIKNIKRLKSSSLQWESLQ